MRSSGSMKSERFTIRFFVAATVALIWTIVLLVFIVAKIDTAPAVAAFFVSLVGIITGIVGVFQPPRFPTIDPKVTRIVVVAILAVNFGVSAWWGSWSYYQANRTVDVLPQITLNNNVGVLPGGHVELDVDVTVKRTHIELVFQATDHNVSTGSCGLNTNFSVMPVMGAYRPGVVTAAPGASVRLGLPEGIRQLHLDIAVTNVRGDHNCAIDLSVASAKLLNG